MFFSILVQLKQNFDTTRLEKFPSKSLLSLNEWQLEERRLMLERYLHTGEGEGGEGEGGRWWVRISCTHSVKVVCWSCSKACLLMHADLVTPDNTLVWVSIPAPHVTL